MTNKSVCDNAVQAFNTQVNHETTGRRVYVFQAGAQYLVVDPVSEDGQGQDGNRLQIFFNSSWVFLSAVVR